MVKKITAGLLILMLAVGLAGCATQDSYASAIRLIQGENWAPPVEETVKPVEILPEPEPEPAPQIMHYGEWPTALPPVAACEAELPHYYSNGAFYASFIMTEKQISYWMNALLATGYQGNPLRNEQMEIRIASLPIDGAFETSPESMAGAAATLPAIPDSGTAQTAPSAQDTTGPEDAQLFYVTIHAFPQAVEHLWPTEFAIFPEFPGTGIYRTFEVTTERNVVTLHAVIEGEARTTVNNYIQILVSAGFENVGYGYYQRMLGGKIYEFQTDGIWADETRADLYWRIY